MSSVGLNIDDYIKRINNMGDIPNKNYYLSHTAFNKYKNKFPTRNQIMNLTQKNIILEKIILFS